VGFAAFYAVCRLTFRLIEVLNGAALPPGLRISDYLIATTALGHGITRVVGFHPAYRPDYCDWLERTPWTSRKPLPLGPVRWVWADGLFIAGLTALAWVDGRIDPIRIVAFPLLSHALALTPALFATGAAASGYASAFALGLAVRVGLSRWEFLAATTAASIVALDGLRRSLTRFPWAVEALDALRQPIQRSVNTRTSGCGWPHDQLQANLSGLDRLDRRQAALITALAGWWLFAVSGLIVPQERFWILVLAVIVEAPTLAIVRMMIYRPGYAPPISLWGRIMTLRWVIPGYDQLYVGPLCTLLVPWPFLYTSWRWGIPYEITVPPGAALTLFVALCCGPSLRNWRLTGQHRIVPTLQQRTEFVKVG
jgi:hypothetical protein